MGAILGAETCDLDHEYFLIYKLYSLLDIHLFLSVCPNLTIVMRYPWLKLDDGSDTGS